MFKVFILFSLRPPCSQALGIVTLPSCSCFLQHKSVNHKISQYFSIVPERPDTDKQVSLNDQANDGAEYLPPLEKYQTTNNIQDLKHHGYGGQHQPRGQEARAALQYTSEMPCKMFRILTVRAPWMRMEAMMM